MKFNPEDGQVTGPRCRNCHKGSSGCGACHNTDPAKDGVNGGTDAEVADNNRTSITYLFAAMFKMGYGADPTNPMFAPFADTETVHGYAPYTGYKTMTTSNNLTNTVATQITTHTLNGNNVEISDQVKSSRTVGWSTSWRQSETTLSATCSDDGLSFPHRTLGWKMLKDDLFGIDFNGAVIEVGQTRTYQGTLMTGAAHDVDSVCLDCHNPTIWNATSALDHTDDAGSADDMDDDLLLRGLP